MNHHPYIYCCICIYLHAVSRLIHAQSELDVPPHIIAVLVITALFHKHWSLLRVLPIHSTPRRSGADQRPSAHRSDLGSLDSIALVGDESAAPQVPLNEQPCFAIEIQLEYHRQVGGRVVCTGEVVDLGDGC